MDSIRTDNTNWAPERLLPYRKPEPLCWRVTTIDEDNNVDPFTTKQISEGKEMSVELHGTLQRSATKSTRSPSEAQTARRWKGAKVKASGADVSKTKTTNKRGTATFRLRPTKARQRDVHDYQVGLRRRD